MSNDTAAKKVRDMNIRGSEGLCKLAELIGYNQGHFSQMQCNNGAFVSSLLAFFDDNPGAIEAVQEFVAKSIDFYDLDDELFEDEDDEEEDEEEEGGTTVEVQPIMVTLTEKPYSVTFWFGDPDTDEGEDCCSAGADFATLEEARAFFDAPEKRDEEFEPDCFNGCAWTMLDGPDVHEVKYDRKVHLAAKKEEELSCGEARREHAHQAGMMGGCEAYNYAMGY